MLIIGSNSKLPCKAPWVLYQFRIISPHHATHHKIIISGLFVALIEYNQVNRTWTSHHWAPVILLYSWIWIIAPGSIINIYTFHIYRFMLNFMNIKLYKIIDFRAFKNANCFATRQCDVNYFGISRETF